MRPVIAVAILILGALACDGVGSAIGAPPSALDMAERQAEYNRRVEEITPFIWGAEGKGTCDQMFRRMKEREAILDNAMQVAYVKSNGDPSREVYDLLAKKLEFVDDLREEITLCQR